jgi:hypothetical protein
MHWAQGFAGVIIAQGTAHHVFGFRLPGWVLLADERLAQAIILAFGVLVAWNVHAGVRYLPVLLAARREERSLERARREEKRPEKTALAYPPPWPFPQPLSFGIDQDGTIMQAVYSGWQGGLRYLGPPAIGTGPQMRVEYELVPSVIEEGVVVGSRLERRELPAVSDDVNYALCGKCGYLLGTHAYYGRHSCVIARPCVHDHCARRSAWTT